MRIHKALAAAGLGTLIALGAVACGTQTAAPVTTSQPAAPAATQPSQADLMQAYKDAATGPEYQAVADDLGILSTDALALDLPSVTTDAQNLGTDTAAYQAVMQAVTPPAGFEDTNSHILKGTALLIRASHAMGTGTLGGLEAGTSLINRASNQISQATAALPG